MPFPADLLDDAVWKLATNDILAEKFGAVCGWQHPARPFHLWETTHRAPVLCGAWKSPMGLPEEGLTQVEVKQLKEANVLVERSFTALRQAPRLDVTFGKFHQLSNGWTTTSSRQSTLISAGLGLKLPNRQRWHPTSWTCPRRTIWGAIIPSKSSSPTTERRTGQNMKALYKGGVSVLFWKQGTGIQGDRRIPSSPQRFAREKHGQAQSSEGPETDTSSGGTHSVKGATLRSWRDWFWVTETERTSQP